MFDADGLVQRFDLLRRGAREARIGHQNIAIAQTFLDKSLGLFQLIRQIRGLQILVFLVCELALNDEAAFYVLVPMRDPGTRKCSVPAAVIGVQKGFYRLTEDLPGHCQTELLKAVPTETVQVVHGFGDWRCCCQASSLPLARGGVKILAQMYLSCPFAHAN